ncbi:MAG TPA: hypothetical protein VHO03_08030 [Ignavibacteriales bacterium]|nr:hypothetical protein [Ignavibacteriales bacterium]
MKIKIYIIALLFCLTKSVFSQTIVSGGILLSGNKNVPFAKRTLVKFTPEKPIYLKDKFTLSFDVSIWTKSTYGRIFRAEDKNGFSIELPYAYHLNKDTSYIILVINKTETSIKIPLPDKELIRNNWFRIELLFDLKNNKIYARTNKGFIASVSVPLPKELNLSLSSGSIFQDFDSPRIALANVEIRNEYNQLIHFWKFEEIYGNKAFDSVSDTYAEVSNGEWLAPKHTKWIKAAKFKFPKIDSFGTAFDSVKQRLLFFDDDYFIEYNIISETFQKKKYNNKRPYHADNPIYNPYNNKIYSYYRGQGQVSIFNEEKRLWSSADSCKRGNEHYYNHTAFINPLNGDLLMFGGYGWFKFKNELRKYNFKTRKWEALKLKGDFIQPRKYAAITQYKSRSEFLIIGGEGTNSGAQEEGIRRYSDVFVLNMKDTSLKKIGEIKNKDRNFDFMNYAYYDKLHTVYFPAVNVFGELTHFYFYKLELNNFTITAIDSIVSDKANFEGASFFVKSSTNEFYININLKTSNYDSVICEIYKISMPPVDHKVFATIQSENEKRISSPQKYLFIFAGLAFIISFLIGYMAIRKRNINKKLTTKIINQSNDSIDDYKKEIVQINSELGISKDLEFKSHFLINLFGSFRIMDRREKEITNELSPKLREILQLIILNMRVQGEAYTGISSEKLTLLLWPDSDPIHAKNNRNSSIAKIRAFLHKIDGLDIEFSENGWIFKTKVSNDCDYLKYLNLRNELSNNPQSINENSLKSYLTILSKGNLLANVSYEWLDPLKVSLESEVISDCFKLTSFYTFSQKPEIIKELMNVVLIWDPINENALRLKINKLIELGCYGEAKSTYELFTFEYQKTLETDYNLTFAELAK